MPEVEIPEGVPTFKIEDYTFVKYIGRGGTGDVSKYKNNLTGEFYTIKYIDTFSDEINYKRHRKQIQHDMVLATNVDHPNVMKCLGVCTNESRIYFLYKYIPINFLSPRRRVKVEAKLAYLAYNILQGLDYLRKEKNIVFKHLTPGNILFDESTGLVKIADVGIVKDKYITLRYVSIVIEHMKYIAPENFHVENHLSDLQSDLYRKSDVWSLGLCLLEIYNGRYPLAYDSLKDIKLHRYLLSKFFTFEPRPDVEHDDWPPKPPSDASPLFCDFVSSCLKLDVSERASIDDLLNHKFLDKKKFGCSTETIVGIAMANARER